MDSKRGRNSLLGEVSGSDDETSDGSPLSANKEKPVLERSMTQVSPGLKRKTALDKEVAASIPKVRWWDLASF